MRKYGVIGMMVAIVAASAGTAFGAGFALIEQSVKGLGTAFSGGAAVADDPSTVFFNPAGMMRLEGQQAQVALHYISPTAKFKEGKATTAFGALAPSISGSPSHKDAGEDGAVPNAYYTMNMGTWAFGVGINVPFGLTTKYSSDWIGRYHAVESDLQTVNINPSVAFKATEKLSLGVGVSAQKVDAKLSSALDIGTIGLLQYAQANGGSTVGSQFIPANMDGFVELNADDWGYGFNLGALYEIDDASRVGFAYRSRIKYTAEGDADFALPTATLGTITSTGNPIDVGVANAILATFLDTDVSADITLPDSASLSYFNQINEQWSVSADITWTNWSVFEELRVEFDQNALGQTVPDNVTIENWDDNWRYSIGTTYALNEAVTLRGGLAYDETPIPDQYRTPRIPGADRFWVALGGGYKVGMWSFDAGYAHLFVDDGKVNLTTPFPPNSSDENVSRGNLSGNFENSVDIVSAEVSYKF